MTEKELGSEEVEAFKRELAEIKADMMRKELEEIKKERLRKELEEIKRERTADAPRPASAYPAFRREPGLSWPNALFAALALLAAGYLIGALYRVDVAAAIDSFLAGYSLPAVGPAIVIALAIILLLIGLGLITLAKK